MKFIVNRQAFTAAMAIAASILPTSTPRPQLLCTMLTAAAGELLVTCGDGDCFIQVRVAEVDIQGTGSLVIPADQVLRILKESTDATVTVEAMDGDGATVAGDSWVFKLFGYPAADYVLPPWLTHGARSPKVTVLMPAAEARGVFDAALACLANKDDSRFSMAALLMHASPDALRLVTTDGRCMMQVTVPGGGTASGQALVPARSAKRLRGLVGAAEEDKVAITWADGVVAVDVKGPKDTLPRVTMVTVQREGTFPPYDEVMPKRPNRPLVIRVQADVLRAALEKAYVFRSVEARAIDVEVKGDELILISGNHEGLCDIHLRPAMHGAFPAGFRTGARVADLVEACRLCKDQEVTLSWEPGKSGALGNLLFSCGRLDMVLTPVNLPVLSERAVQEKEAA